MSPASSTAPGPEALVATVAAGAGALLGADAAVVVRYEQDSVAVVARWPETGHQSALVDHATSAPIVVDGRPWGELTVHSRQPLAADAQAGLDRFAHLLGTALSDVQSKAEARRLADEQAALRRVATLVAQEATPEAVFALIAEELARLLEVDDTRMARFEAGDVATIVAGWGSFEDRLPTGTRVTLSGETVSGIVRRTERPARIDDYSKLTGPFAQLLREGRAQSAVGTPIVVDGRAWGVMVVGSRGTTPLPADTEARVQAFCELAATAISNSEARRELARLADEQAALRRIATLVAEGATPSVVFSAVTEEVAELMHADQIALTRFEPGPAIAVLAHRGRHAALAPAGTSVPLRGESVNAMVHRTGRPARMDNFEDATGSIVRFVPEMSTAVGTPIYVEGSLWGTITAGWLDTEPAPPDAEERLTKFATLVEVAIANADSRAQLTASRARMVVAGDEARRRVVRDLHDGAQQRLVHTIVTLKLARQALDEDPAVAPALVGEALEQADRAHGELRALAQGLLPSTLTSGGLRAGVEALISDVKLPVTLELPADRFSPGIEASAYFVVAEALTNVLKHAHAERATVTGRVADGTLEVQISDDGVGGADPEAAGTGLVGLTDRVTALGGELRVVSPPDGGTTVTAVLPIAPG